MSRSLGKTAAGPQLPEVTWITDVPQAVMTLLPINHRGMKKWSKKKGNEVYLHMEDDTAIDLCWFAGKLAQHTMQTLVSEKAPGEAKSLKVARSESHSGGRWTTYLAHCVHLISRLVQFGNDKEFPEVMKSLQECDGKGVKLLTDTLVFTMAVGLSTSAPSEDKDELSDCDYEGDDAETADSGVPAEQNGARDKEEDEAAGIEPIDLVGMSLKALSQLLRHEHKRNEKKSEESGIDEKIKSCLVEHVLMKEILVDGLFDAMAAFFEIWDSTSMDLRRKDLAIYLSACVDMLYLCSSRENYVSELVISECMQEGRAMSVLKKVLYMDQNPEIISNMLRWLLLFAEYEDPPTVDIMAGYDLYGRLLLSIIERSNTAMKAWGARQAFNPLACDLLKAVEIFADDSNFKTRVIDTSTEALAAVLKRGPEYNAFGKADNMHFPFTQAYFKLLAALHAFNPEVESQEHFQLFAKMLAEECKTNEERNAVSECMEFLLTIPDIAKRVKFEIEPILEEDLELLSDLIEAFKKHTRAGAKGSSQRAGSSAKSKTPRGKAAGRAGSTPEAKGSPKSESSSKPATTSGSSNSGRSAGKRRRGLENLTEDEMIRLAIQKSLSES